VYDVIWTAPRFNTNGSLQSPALVTALLNGVLVQNNVSLKGYGAREKMNKNRIVFA